jgi:membrane protease YdiL (CAAX protease family)
LRRAPLVAFLVLACLLSWWPWPLYEAGLMPLPIASFGPFLAALVVLGVTQGRGGVVLLLRSMVRWRIPARAYLWAVGVPLLCSGSAVLLNLALGARTPVAAEVLGLVLALPLAFVVVLLVPGFGGALEEPGFRGYALGRLEDRFGWTAGPLVLGLFIVLWHLPVFATEGIEWTDVLVIPATSVVIAGIFHLGRESVLIAMLTHAVNNAVGGALASRLFTGADSVQLGALTAAAWWLAAAVVIVHRHRSGRSTVDDLGQSRHPSGADPSV